VDWDGPWVNAAVGIETRASDLLARYASYAAVACSTDVTGAVTGWSTIAINNTESLGRTFRILYFYLWLRNLNSSVKYQRCPVLMPASKCIGD